MRALFSVVSFLGLAICGASAFAIDPYLGNDPYWVLLHEPAVLKDLKLDAMQREAYGRLLDDLDLKFFPLRNQSVDEATAGMAKISQEVKTQLTTLLKPEQLRRIDQILLQFQGNNSFVRDDVATRLACTTAQRTRMKEIVAETEAALAKSDQNGNEAPKETAEARFVRLKVDEQRKLIAVLKQEQLDAFKAMLGVPFPLAELRKPSFKAPELVNTREWINSKPLTIADQRGKVVVVHFYAAGCVNCIHNYPWYKHWHKLFDENEIVMIGIHSPETSSERDSNHVRRKAVEEKLEFPILIDGKSENWNAWGNSMWPSVYLIDKRGYLREFWPGELKWQGRDGERYMRDKIKSLLAEPASQ